VQPSQGLKVESVHSILDRSAIFYLLIRESLDNAARIMA